MWQKWKGRSFSSSFIIPGPGIILWSCKVGVETLPQKCIFKQQNSLPKDIANSGNFKREFKHIHCRMGKLLDHGCLSQEVMIHIPSKDPVLLYIISQGHKRGGGDAWALIWLLWTANWPFCEPNIGLDRPLDCSRMPLLIFLRTLNMVLRVIYRASKLCLLFTRRINKMAIH